MKQTKSIKIIYIVGMLFIFGIFILSISCSSQSNDGVTEFDEATQAELEKAVLDNMTIDGVEIPGVVVGIWTPDKGNWVRAFGSADTSTDRPVKTSDGFRIASITKTFTATIILQLKDENKLSLDDTLADFGFTDVPNADIITVRNLLNMTSGIFDYIEDEHFVEVTNESNYTYVWTPEELLDCATSHPVYFSPGERCKYTNTNYILLGMIIEKITGNTYESEIKNRITDPLNLTKTRYPVGSVLDDTFSRGYSIVSGTLTDTTTMEPSEAWSAGGLVSNLEDLKNWAIAMGTGSLLEPATQQDRITWNGLPTEGQSGKYCLGGYWLGNNVLFGHSGIIRGYSGAAFYMPGRKATFVILANTNFLEPNGAIEGLAKIVYPDDVE